MIQQGYSGGRFPLPQGQVVTTGNLDELRRVVSQETVNRHFALTSPQQNPQFRLSRLRLNHGQIYGCSHSVSLLCESAPLDCFEIYCVGEGLLVSRPDSSRHFVRAGAGIIHLPGERSINSWEAGFQALVFRISPTALRNYLGARDAARVDQRDFRRSRVFSLRDRLGQSLITLTAQVCLAHCSEPERDQQSRALEDLLIHNLALIIAQRMAGNSVADTQGESDHLERAIDFIYSHLEENITLESLSAAAGVTGRMLQYLFAARFGIGPISFVKREKLKRARRDLLRATPERASVTEIACRWGFTNLSHFSRSYRAMFDEPPSATLRRMIPVGQPPKSVYRA